jgi:acyl-CoA thioester hydrolase
VSIPAIVASPSDTEAATLLLVTDTRDSFDIHLRWGDMDAFRHINNVQVARLFEQSRIESFQRWFGVDRRKIHLLVARQEIEYCAVLHYSTEPVTINCSISAIGGASLEFACELVDPTGTVCALSETTLVTIDREGSAVAIPDGVRAVLEQHRGAPTPFRRRRSGSADAGR